MNKWDGRTHTYMNRTGTAIDYLLRRPPHRPGIRQKNYQSGVTSEMVETTVPVSSGYLKTSDGSDMAVGGWWRHGWNDRDNLLVELFRFSCGACFVWPFFNLFYVSVKRLTKNPPRKVENFASLWLVNLNKFLVGAARHTLLERNWNLKAYFYQCIVETSTFHWAKER